MEDRILRFIDKQGRLTLSKVYRGNLLDGEVELINRDGGIAIVPFKGDGRRKCIRKFDVKDRLSIPADMRKIFKMGEAVEVYREDDGTLFIRVPKEMCFICGCTEDVHQFMDNKYICKNCLEEIHRKLPGSSSDEQ